MCRLFALTDTSLPPGVRKDVLDRAMLLHLGEGQHHGWGVTDGQRVWKGAGRYGRDMRWVNEAADQTILVGHVRHASEGTGLSDKEAHPFVFPDFIGVHNGFFDLDLGFDTKEADSDSFRGFLLLQWLWEGHYGPLPPRRCEEWLRYLYDGSGLAVLLLPRLNQGHVLQVYKDDRSKLFYCPVGNGYLLTTSRTVMSDLRHYLATRHGQTCGLFAAVPPFRLFTLTAGSPKYHDAPVPFSPKRRPLGDRVWKWLNS